MADRQKLTFISAITLALIALIILAAGIPELKLLPGTIFYTEDTKEQDNYNPPATFPIKVDEKTPSPAIVVLILILIPILISIVLMIIFPKMRKQVLRNLIFIATWGLAIYMLYRRKVFDLIPSEKFTAVDIASEREIVDLPFFTHAPLPDVNRDASTLIAFVVGFFIILFLLILVYLFYRRSKVIREDGEELELIAIKAQNALNEINSGADLHNTILNCYIEMSEVLENEKGIRRKFWMTPREFEQRLVSTGLPIQSVQTLTELFEAVRYGGQIPDSVQEAQAVESLEAIVEYARRDL
jgi:competence protein ComGC